LHATIVDLRPLTAGKDSAGSVNIPQMRARCRLTATGAGRLCPDGTGSAAPGCMRQITPSPVFPFQAALKVTGAGNGILDHE